MPNAHVQAAPEGLPKVSRRAVLAGLGSLAAAPAVAITPPVQETLGALLAQHQEIWTECRRISKFVDGLLTARTAPSYPFVQPTELGPDHGFLGTAPKWYSVKEIDHFFDGCHQSTEWHIKHGFTPNAHRKRIERLDTHRATAKKMLADRQAAYRAWQDEIGITAAEDEQDRLADIELELDQRIMTWPVRSLDEARQIAGHLKRLHGEKIPEEDAKRFLALFAQEGRS